MISFNIRSVEEHMDRLADAIVSLILQGGQKEKIRRLEEIYHNLEVYKFNRDRARSLRRISNTKPSGMGATI